MSGQIHAPDVGYLLLSPELVLVGAAFLVMLVRAFVPKGQRLLVANVVAIGALTLAAILSLGIWDRINVGGAELLLGQMIAVDGYAVFFKVLFIGVAALAILMGTPGLRDEGYLREEFPALVLLATVGMSLMASAADLIVVFLALELFSLSLYVIAAFARDRLGPQEAALKYFLLGAFSSAFFLYGVALVYGAVGSTNLVEIAAVLQTSTASPGLLIGAAAFMLVGLGFKVAAVPFHMWAPDVYQGAPTPVVGFLAAGAKAAGFAAFFRIFVAAMAGIRVDWAPVVAGLAALTMFGGAVIALVQKDIKRMLAYSSIVHAGYLLIGVAAGNAEGVSSALFYLVSYALMVFGAFAVVGMIAGRSDRFTAIADFAGLGRRNPGLAAVFTVFLLGLAGIPLTSGFIAKLGVFQAAVDAGMTWLAILGVIASVIAAYFYLRVIIVMYVSEPEVAEVPEPGADLSVQIGIALTLGLTVLLGVLPQALISASENARLLLPGL